jgi:hypothetical protein
MRYLGADPNRPMGRIERQVTIALHNRVIREERRAHEKG